MEKSERNAEGEDGEKRAGGGEGKETFRKRNPEQISRPAPD